MRPFPLVGLDVHVAAASERHHDEVAHAFEGLLAAEPSDWHTTVLRSDGRLCSVANERVTFRDPCRAARLLRAHAATTEAQGLGFAVVPEYTPPRWVQAKDVAVGTPVLAVRWPEGEQAALGPGTYVASPITADTLTYYRRDNAMILVGEWPPLPKETT